MVRTVLGSVLMLVVFGWLLMRLLHFTLRAANLAGGFVFRLIALNMLVSLGKKHGPQKLATTI